MDSSRICHFLFSTSRFHEGFHGSAIRFFEAAKTANNGRLIVRRVTFDGYSGFFTTFNTYFNRVSRDVYLVLRWHFMNDEMARGHCEERCNTCHLSTCTTGRLKRIDLILPCTIQLCIVHFQRDISDHFKYHTPTIAPSKRPYFRRLAMSLFYRAMEADSVSKMPVSFPAHIDTRGT